MASEPEFTVFHPNRPGIRKVLGELEAEIMELIWARPASERITVHEIFEILYERRHLAYTTVMSTMARLAKKGLLRVEKDKQAYLYTPTLTQEEFVSQVVGHILENLLVSFSGATLASVQAMPDEQSAARARKLLDEITRRRAAEEAEAPKPEEEA